MYIVKGRGHYFLANVASLSAGQLARLRTEKAGSVLEMEIRDGEFIVIDKQTGTFKKQDGLDIIEMKS